MTAAPLALSLGDPAGIGPEITVKAWRALREKGPAFMVIGDAQALGSTPGAPAPIRAVTGPLEAAHTFAEAIPVLDIPLSTPVVAGQPNPANGASVIRWIETGAGLALSGDVSGLVTAPIAKAPLYAAGFRFPGHTEFLADLSAAEQQGGPRGPVMMLIAGDLRVALVTIHTPLAAVPAQITVEKVVNTALVTYRALKQDFGIESPRMVLCGLNPHAGESGEIGREEIDVLQPAVRALADLGVALRGPLPADSLFHAEARAGYDAAICLYHDQALIPVKMLDFWGGVNVTLGLPIVRTSPDHGTGFDIAGRGLARPDSMIAAIRLAAQIADRRSA